MWAPLDICDCIMWWSGVWWEDGHCLTYIVFERSRRQSEHIGETLASVISLPT